MAILGEQPSDIYWLAAVLAYTGGLARPTVFIAVYRSTFSIRNVFYLYLQVGIRLIQAAQSTFAWIVDRLPGTLCLRSDRIDTRRSTGDSCT